MLRSGSVRVAAIRASRAAAGNDLFDESGDRYGQGTIELPCGESGPSVTRELFGQTPKCGRRVEVELIGQELVRVNCLDVIPGQRAAGKVPKVGRHDDCG